MRRPGGVLAIPLLPFSLLTASCLGVDGTSDAPRQLSHDLVAALDSAEVTAEVMGVDLVGDDTEHYRAGGFAEGEKRREYRWSRGEASAVEFPLLRPRDLELVFRCRPFVFPDSPPQRLELRLNGAAVEELELAPQAENYRVRLESSALVTGVNRLTVRYGYHRRPADVLPDSRDERSLAVAWYELKLLEAGQSAAAVAPTPGVRADPERSRLAISFGAQVDYYLAVEPGAELVVGEWRLRDPQTRRVEVFWHEEGAEDRLLAVVQGDERPKRLTLTGRPGSPATGPRIGRLRLRALASPPASPGDAAVLVEPAIWAAPRASPPAAATAEVRRRPNVFIYMIDTLRADRLGCYGHPGGLTPEIDAFAAEAIVFENAMAQSSWTRSSVASLFTGLWPVEHAALKRNHKLSDPALTLAEILKDAGYATAAFVTNPNVTRQFGFDQGFDEFIDLGIEARSDDVNEAVLTWLKERRDLDEPFFLYVHTIDPHDPYHPPSELLGADSPDPLRMHKVLNDYQSGRREVREPQVKRLETLYEAEIVFNDRSFGELVDALREENLYDEAWILLLSDHGEEFYDHGHFKHGRALYEESLRIPLVVKRPGSTAGRRVAARVQHIDVLPTLLDDLGLPRPAGLEGRNVLRGVEPAPLFSYLHLDGAPRISVTEGDWKLIGQRDGDAVIRHRLYDLGRDPGERHDLSGDAEIRRGYLASLLRRKLRVTERQLIQEATAIDEATRRQLEALGYLE